MITYEYVCDRCHGVFEKGWSDEEADAEFHQIFGNLRKDQLLCDDCYILWMSKGFFDEIEIPP